MLAEVNQTLAKKDIDLEVSQELRTLSQKKAMMKMGVRPLRRAGNNKFVIRWADFHLDHLDAKHLEADGMVFGSFKKASNTRFWE